MLYFISEVNKPAELLGTDEAENLMGCGDMLYLPNGVKNTLNLQGFYITEDEIAKVVEFIKRETGD